MRDDEDIELIEKFLSGELTPDEKNEFDKKAVLCGICKSVLTIREYLASGSHCPYCHTAFNPNCSQHYHLYFEI